MKYIIFIYSSTERCNKSDISDGFKHTIEHLVDSGADPTIANDSGIDVNTLFSESGIGALSMLVARKLTYHNTRDLPQRTVEPHMLIKEEDGTIKTVDINHREPRRIASDNRIKAIINNTGKNPTEITVENTVVTNTLNDKIKNTFNDIKSINESIKNTVNEAIKSTEKDIELLNDTEDVEASKMIVVSNSLNISSSLKDDINVQANATIVENVTRQNVNKVVILDNKLVNTVDKNATTGAVDAQPKQFINSFKNFVENFNVKYVSPRWKRSAECDDEDSEGKPTRKRRTQIVKSSDFLPTPWKVVKSDNIVVNRLRDAVILNKNVIKDKTGVIDGGTPQNMSKFNEPAKLATLPLKKLPETITLHSHDSGGIVVIPESEASGSKTS